MNRFLKMIIAVSAAVLSLSATAQDKEDNGWKERMMSEKIAFLTTEIGLTPEEAQAFWPVYNKSWEEKGEAHFNLMKTYGELADATKSGKPQKELSGILDRYLDAIDNMNATDKRIAEEYKKVLPIDKVAKLYVAEEKFRRMQIHKLHHGRDKDR